MTDATQQASAPLALVTGATGEIGKASAMALAALGFKVALADIAPGTSLKETAATIASPVDPLYLDITDEASVHGVFDKIEQQLGPLTALVCSAGIMPVPASGALSIADTDLEHWDHVLAVNAGGTFLCVREMLRLRTRQPLTNSRIVTISSAAAQLGGYRGDASYVASKAAILGLTKIAARQAAPLGMTVNCIAPGPIYSAMFNNAVAADDIPKIEALIPLGRVGQAADVGGAVAYLCSEAAGWVTGTTLDVNGGYRMQ